MRLLLDLVGDPARLNVLMQQLEQRTEGLPGSVRVGAFLNILRGLARVRQPHEPGQLDQTLKQVGQASGRLSAEAMLELLARRGEARKRWPAVGRRRQRDGAPHERLGGRGVRRRTRSSPSAVRPIGWRRRSRPSCPTRTGSASCCRWRKPDVAAVRARPGSRVPGPVAEGRGDAHLVLGREIRLRRAARAS